MGVCLLPPRSFPSVGWGVEAKHQLETWSGLADGRLRSGAIGGDDNNGYADEHNYRAGGKLLCPFLLRVSELILCSLLPTPCAWTTLFL